MMWMKLQAYSQILEALFDKQELELVIIREYLFYYSIFLKELELGVY